MPLFCTPHMIASTQVLTSSKDLRHVGQILFRGLGDQKPRRRLSDSELELTHPSKFDNNRHPIPATCRTDQSPHSMRSGSSYHLDLRTHAIILTMRYSSTTALRPRAIMLLSPLHFARPTLLSPSKLQPPVTNGTAYSPLSPLEQSLHPMYTVTLPSSAITFRGMGGTMPRDRSIPRDTVTFSARGLPLGIMGLPIDWTERLA